jgi:hypothetical protein
MLCSIGLVGQAIAIGVGYALIKWAYQLATSLVNPHDQYDIIPIHDGQWTNDQDQNRFIHGNGDGDEPKNKKKKGNKADVVAGIPL